MITLPRNPIAVQMYTVRDVAAKDFPGTLRRLADGGVRAVEFAGYGGMLVENLASLILELGLRVPASHLPVALWEQRPTESLAELTELGGEYAVVPWVPEERRGSMAAARALAADLNRWAAAARDQGIGFAYHHHDFEFVPLPDGDGATLFDILVRETDPGLVGFEIDAYWAARGGADPARLLRDLEGRVPLLHLKDLGAGPDQPDVPAGEGTLPWDEILPAATAAGATWWIVEQDNPRDSIAEALLGVRNVEAMGERG